MSSFAYSLPSSQLKSLKSTPRGAPLLSTAQLPKYPIPRDADVTVPPITAQAPTKSRTEILANVHAETEEPTMPTPLPVSASQKPVTQIKLGMLLLASASAMSPLLLVPLVRFGTTRLVAALFAALSVKSQIQLEQPVCALTLLLQQVVQLAELGAILPADVTVPHQIQLATLGSDGVMIAVHAGSNVPSQSDLIQLEHHAFAPMLPQLLLVLLIECGTPLPADATALPQLSVLPTSSGVLRSAGVHAT